MVGRPFNASELSALCALAPACMLTLLKSALAEKVILDDPEAAAEVIPALAVAMSTTLIAHLAQVQDLACGKEDKDEQQKEER